ncbi:T9SS type A sorting domain-containing protein [Flavobacterium sp.]|uniref:T9SS type A sorting domain-containing protein n=1 Tax=Flavobacterium sp. TaxID=239 RepID=UPI00286D8E83|nr:T9SS type A sorting domain-containing protein [Flavobacterium sp.]
MKTKLFSFFIAVFLISFSGKAQTNAKTSVDFPVITLIGAGNGGWTNDAETTMLTSDGITYTLVDRILTDGEVKFREGKCWTTGCPATVTNTFGWGPTDADYALNGGWPSGANNAPKDNGKNIKSVAGSWTITFNRIQGSWTFVPGTPIPVIKVVGTAVSAVDGAMLTTADGIIFSAKKVSLKPGTCKIEINGTSYGSAVAPGFPMGTADSATGSIAVTTTGIDYDVTFDYSSGAYDFKVATFPTIALVGSAVGGWPGTPDNPGPIDKNQMATTDGITYTLNNVPVVGGGPDQKCLFRVGNAWDKKYGSSAFPEGMGAGGGDILVPDVAMTGTYNVTLNTSTGAYTFTKITYAIVGAGVGGWPGEPGNPGPIDVHQLSTVDGINYTINGLVVTTDIIKFRINNAWAGGDWGGTTFPAGTKSNDNIPAKAGTYNLTVNVLTGAYDFGTNLGVAKFDAKSFKAYPNPTRGSWNITSSNDDIISVQVYDVLGKTVYAKNSAAKEVSVNATELSKGVYFAKVSSANGASTIKLVKE